MARGMSPYAAVEPRFDDGTDPILAELCRVASRAVRDAWLNHSRDALLSAVKDLGADGTPTYLIDELVEQRIVEAAGSLRVNIVSEEMGVVDLGADRTVFVDPLDGSANAGAGVPLSCFSGALAVEGRPTSALTCWLETGHTVAATVGHPSRLATSGRTELVGAAVDMLRPKLGERGRCDRAFWAITDVASRIRILSSSCLESMLVAQASIDAFADPGSDTHRIVDLAAAMVFVPAAGGVVLDAFGRPIELDHDLRRRWSGVVAATPQLGEQIADTIAWAMPGELGTIGASGQAYTLRRARTEDLRSAEDLLTGALGDEGVAADGQMAAWQRAFDRIDSSREGMVVVATDRHDRPVAVLHSTVIPSMGNGGKPTGVIEFLAVREDLRGVGIGTGMLEWLIRRAKRERQGELQLLGAPSGESVRVFERAGFVRTDIGTRLKLSAAG